MVQTATKEEIKIQIPKEPAKKAVFIIAFRDFRDQEYFTPKWILEKGGIETKTASVKRGIAVGADGGDADVDLILNEVNINDFEAIIFVGGPGCLDDLDNETSYRLVKDAVSQNKILAAICIAPVILAKAGVLKEKNATVWTSALDRGTIKILEQSGAYFADEKVVRDGRIITANGPSAAEDFANKILINLNR